MPAISGPIAGWDWQCGAVEFTLDAKAKQGPVFCMVTRTLVG